MTFDIAALSPEELVVLIAEAKRTLHPEPRSPVTNQNARTVTRAVFPH
jgi:hypothetical protein